MSPDETETIVVVGAGGFTGSAVARALVATVRGGGLRAANGARIGRVAAMLSPAGDPFRLNDIAPGDDYVVERADITDPRGFAAVLKRLRPEAIIYAARPPQLDLPLSAEEQRALVTEPLAVCADALSKARLARLVTTGSAAVVVPGRAMAEGDPIAPHASYFDYAKNKIVEERALAELAPRLAGGVAHLRLFYVFGSFEQPHRLVPAAAAAAIKGREIALSSGTHLRDYVSVDDVARAYLRAVAADLPPRKYTPFHIGSGRGLSICEVATAAAAAVGDPAVLQFGETETHDMDATPWIADVTCARRILGWEPDPDPLARIADAARWWQARLAI